MVASNFTPKSGWAPETDDPIELSKAGVLESLTWVDPEIQLQPALAASWKQTARPPGTSPSSKGPR